MPFFRVIPAFRAPRAIQGFDYVGSADARVGDIVQIPFRTQTIVGVVAQKLAKTGVPQKAIKEIVGSYAGLQLTPKTLKMIDALAVRSFSSPASVLHAWIGTTPKRPKEGSTDNRRAAFQGEVGSRLLLNRWHADDGIIETAKKAVRDGCRVLILTPWTVQAKALADACGGTALTSDLAGGARFAAWAGFVRGEIRCVVATRIGAWLATEADVVIVDEPENDDHKQDELAPRYDARWVAAEAKRAGIPVVAIGLTPRVASPAPIPAISSTHVTWVDIHRADWSTVAGLQGRALMAAEEAMEAGHPVHIIHPIHGLRARLRCADCSWSASCSRCGAGLTPSADRLMCQRCKHEEPMPIACPSCNGTDFSKSRPGRDALARDLAKENLHATVHSIGEWHAASASLEPQSLVVLTDLSLLPGMSEDIRRRERVIMSLRRLADICVSSDTHLVVQGDPALLDEARLWLTSTGCEEALKREWDERKAFQLPPATRLVKLIVRGSPAAADQLMTKLRPRLPQNASLNGPFTVERIPGTRTPRAIIQAVFPPSTPDSAIQTALSPVLSDQILVDLDPIAFFE